MSTVQPQVSAARPERPLVRLAAFGGLGLYGVLRWATLAPAQGHGRLLALLVLALVLCAVGPIITRRRRVLAALPVLLASFMALAVAGIPVSWITHLRVAVTGQWIGNGMADIPGMLTPYQGSDHWLLIVIALGAAVLLTCAATVMALAPAGVGGLTRAAAALPLIALAAIPTALVRPKSPSLEGLVLFALLCAFLWGEQVRRDRVAVAILVCAAAGAAAIALAPGLQTGKPWLDYEGLANGTAVGARAERFDWTQRYGPIVWPRSGRPVLEVQAPHTDYWKAQDLDAFDGRGWTQGVVAGAQELPGPTAAATARFSQSIAVRIREMTTPDVIGAGTVMALTNLPKPVVPGASPGTWSAATPLAPGERYRARVYSPHPGPAQLQAAGSDYTDVPSGYRTLELPFGSAPQVAFAAFHSGQPPLLIAGSRLVDARPLVAASPYAGAFALAQRLSAQADTPYDYVQSVMGFLHRGFSYNESPPARAYPLESFLFVDRKGYCQQFAGAMALLLRMGGVPARVAVGFTPGSYASATRSWVVTDMDAHAWVEAWFPGYGWVRFDPTPGADPALQHVAPAGSPPPTDASSPSRQPTPVRPQRASHPRVNAKRSLPDGRAAASAGGTGMWLPLLIVALALALVALALLVTRPLRGLDAAIAELERAFGRSRRPLPGGVTLAQLEHRLRGSPGAAGYVQRLRLNRYGCGQRMPSATQRRALRAHLATGLRVLGRLRALWALPPRRRAPLPWTRGSGIRGLGRPHGA